MKKRNGSSSSLNSDERNQSTTDAPSTKSPDIGPKLSRADSAEVDNLDIPILDDATNVKISTGSEGGGRPTIIYISYKDIRPMILSRLV